MTDKQMIDGWQQTNKQLTQPVGDVVANMFGFLRTTIAGLQNEPYIEIYFRYNTLQK